MIKQVYYRLGRKCSPRALYTTRWPLADPSEIEQKVLVWSESDSDDGEESLKGRDGSSPPDPEHTRDADIDLINPRQVFVA